MQQWKSYIILAMTVYLSALILFPCNDSCDTDTHDISVNIEQAQDHHNHDQDMCSPFCICSCCSTSLSVEKLFTYHIGPDHIQKETFAYYSSFISDFHYSIWQPPKLG